MAAVQHKDDAIGAWVTLRPVPLWATLEYETVGGVQRRWAREIAAIRRARAEQFLRQLVEREVAA